LNNERLPLNIQGSGFSRSFPLTGIADVMKVQADKK